jgi:hypothetical protein
MIKKPMSNRERFDKIEYVNSKRWMAG